MSLWECNLRLNCGTWVLSWVAREAVPNVAVRPSVNHVSLTCADEIIDVHHGAQAMGEVLVPRDVREFFRGESTNASPDSAPIHLPNLHKIARGELTGNCEHAHWQQRSTTAAQCGGSAIINNDRSLDLSGMLQPELTGGGAVTRGVEPRANRLPQ